MTTPLTPKYHAPIPPLDDTDRAIFTAARSLIAEPEHHFQGSLAVSRTGHRVEPTDPTACRFCGIGALLATIGTPCQIDEAAIPYIERLSLVTEHVMDDDRVPFTHINDGIISHIQFPEEMQSLTPHQRVLYIYDEVLKS